MTDTDTVPEAVLAALGNPPYSTFPTSELYTLRAAAITDGDDATVDLITEQLRARSRDVFPIRGDYEPDPASIDALVDADGDPTPKPTAAEGYEPVDAGDVMAALAALVDLADSFLVAGTGSIEDRIRLHIALGDAVGREGALTRVRKILGQRIPLDMEGPVEVDGRWWRAGRSRRTSGWDKVGLRAAINRSVMTMDPDAPVTTVDTTTGQPVLAPSVVIDRLWKFVDVATGRSKVLREGAGIEAEDFATVEWSDALEEVGVRP